MPSLVGNLQIQEQFLKRTTCKKCEYFLFVYIVKQNQKRSKTCGLKIKICGFAKMKIEFCWRQIFEISIIHKPSQVTLRSHTRKGLDQFSRVDVYWIQTDR